MIWLWCALVFVLIADSTAVGADADEPTKLPAFEVRDSRVGAYGAGDATSATRVSVPIQDLAQSVSVVTRELIEDTHGLGLVDVARFATPIIQNWHGGGDWYSIRGFRTSFRFIDGVQVGVQGNRPFANLSNIERLEIVKGPNTVLVPGADAGGRINQITKSPQFERFTRLTLRARSYLGNEVSLDANRVLDGGNSAVRLVATYWNSDGYFHRQFRRGWLAAPSFAHWFSDRTELIVKLEMLENTESNLMGVGIDPAVGTRVGGYARKHPLLPRDNQWPPFDENRSGREARLTSELRFPVGERVAARLWLTADHVSFTTPTPGGAQHAAGLQGSRHPLTGEWEPFKRFSYDATTGAVAEFDLVPSTTTSFTRNRAKSQEHYDELHFKNDYALEYELGGMGRALTLLGLTANWLPRVDSRWWRYNRPDLDQFINGRPVSSEGDAASALVPFIDKEAAQKDVQAFLYQRVHLLDDRLILSGGVAEFYGVLERLDDTTLPPILERETRNAITDLNLGAVFKPRPEIALFAGYNRTGGALPYATTAGEYTTESFRVGLGAQLEFGVKTSWLGGRITTSAAWFDLTQDNVPEFNTRSILFPKEPRFFYFDMVNRGWEIEGNALVTPSFELVGNFTRMKMRDTFGVPALMVPDEAGAVFANYTIREGRWKGLGVSFGVDYVGRLPGPSTGDNPLEIPFTDAGARNQPSFYVAPRTLLQVGVSYARDRWKLSVVVHNLTNEDYIHAASTRHGMLPGEPRNYSATLGLRW